MNHVETNGCRLCPRACGVKRDGGQKGRCHVDGRILIARAALHFWEEPCISGKAGSGAVFFSGCPLGCVYCQNRSISRGHVGTEVSVERLAEIFLELQEQGANNINLVTAGHYTPQVCQALRMAKRNGLLIPIVWNSSGYETVATLQMLEGLADVYLPDLKYLSPELAKKYSQAEDYPEIAKSALREMVRQQPEPRMNGEGMIISGVIVRHLLLPGHVREAKRVVSFLHETYGDQIYISLMNQYTPPGMEPTDANRASAIQTVGEKKTFGIQKTDMQKSDRDASQGGAVRGIASVDPLLARKVTKREYERLLDYALQIGVEQGFYQEGDTAAESFIPTFDGTGVSG